MQKKQILGIPEWGKKKIQTKLEKVRVKKKHQNQMKEYSECVLLFEPFFMSIVSKSHFLANLEASKIHSTPYLKPKATANPVFMHTHSQRHSFILSAFEKTSSWHSGRE